MHLARRGRAISERTGRHIRAALENVGDVNISARETHRLDNFGEQLAGPTDERFALRVFIGARRFTDEHDLGIRIANSENGLRAGASEIWTFCANGDTRLHGS